MGLARAAARVRKGASRIDYLFGEKREMLVRMIEFDEEWSGPWIAAHPRPATREPGDGVQGGRGGALVNRTPTTPTDLHRHDRGKAVLLYYFKAAKPLCPLTASPSYCSTV